MDDIQFVQEKALRKPRELSYKVDYFTRCLKTRCRNRDGYILIGSVACAECPYYCGVGSKANTILCKKRKRKLTEE